MEELAESSVKAVSKQCQSSVKAVSKMYPLCFPRPTPPKNPPHPTPPPVESHVSEVPVEIAQLDKLQPPLTQGAQSKGPQCSYSHEQGTPVQL
jgi:hypothetical protein